jgi:hypothetical protein
MKIWNHIFPTYFFCKLDEKNSINLLNLDTIENKYSYNINCKIKLKPYNLKFFCKIPIKKISKNKSFVNQYILFK